LHVSGKIPLWIQFFIRLKYPFAHIVSRTGGLNGRGVTGNRKSKEPGPVASLTKQKTIQSQLKIPNHKQIAMIKIRNSKPVLDIGYLNLRFIWNLVLHN